MFQKFILYAVFNKQSAKERAAFLGDVNDALLSGEARLGDDGVAAFGEIETFVIIAEKTKPSENPKIMLQTIKPIATNPPIERIPPINEKSFLVIKRCTYTK